MKKKRNTADVICLDDYRDRADRKRQTREALCGSTDADDDYGDDYGGPEVVDHLESARRLLIQAFESLGEPVPATLHSPEGPEAA